MNRLLITILLAILGIGLALPAASQRIEDFSYLNDYADDASYLGLGINRSVLKNDAAPSPENHHKSGFTLYLDLRKLRLEQGRASIYYSNQLLGDLLWLLQKTTENANNANRDEGSSISSGLFGWVNVGWNLTKGGLVQPFLGFHHNDYFLTSTYVADTIPTSYNQRTYEPQGYLFAAGPLVGLRAALGGFALLEARSTYSFTYLRAASIPNALKNNDYPKSHFVHLQVECISKWGLFASFQHHRLINRGNLPNETRRWDTTLGFRFML